MNTTLRRVGSSLTSTPNDLHIRIYTFGTFGIEWVDPQTGQIIPFPPERLQGGRVASSWALFKALLGCSDRFAPRSWLLEQFWPVSKNSTATERLNDVASALRVLLRQKESKTSLVHFIYGGDGKGAGYRLEGYPQIWCDADAFEWYVKHGLLLDQRGLDSSACWERAYRLSERGVYLPEHVYEEWAKQRRERLDGLRRDCVHRWTKLLHQAGHVNEAILRLRWYWLEYPTDEDALRPLMEMLGECERFQEAEECYAKMQAALAEDGHEPDERTKETMEVVRALQIRRLPSTAPSLVSRTLEPIPAAEPLPFQTFTPSQLTALASLMRLGETIMFDPTKRKTLETLLIALSGTFVKPEGFLQPEALKHILEPETDLARVNEVTIQGFAKLIEACWQLSRGNELTLAEKLLPECMTKLVLIAQQPSKYQQAAANLAAQGFRIYGVLALHRNDLQAKELYCKQAIQYSQIAEDQNLLIASLKGLGHTYYSSNQHVWSLRTYMEALQYTKGASLLLQSCVHRYMAVAYAHLDQKQEALTSLGLAVETFPDHPESDPGFSFADFDLPSLLLGEGIVLSKVGQTKQALDAFGRMDQPAFIAPERFRIEIINQRAKTAIFAGELEQGCTYVEAGVTGAKTLGSQRRLSEAYDNYKQMVILWPMEKRVKELAELF